jgi:hypothetical protein
MQPCSKTKVTPIRCKLSVSQNVIYFQRRQKFISTEVNTQKKIYAIALSRLYDSFTVFFIENFLTVDQLIQAIQSGSKNNDLLAKMKLICP